MVHPPLKILQVCSASQIGGGEIYVRDLCRALIARGHEVHLAAPPDGRLAQTLSRDPIPIHPIPLRNALDFIGIARLARCLRGHRFDVVHAHRARDYVPCALAVSWARVGRLVVTRQLHFPLKSNGFYRYLFRRVHRAIAVSDRIYASLQRQFHLSPQRLVKIPNAIHTSAYDGLYDAAEIRRRFHLHRRYAVAVVGEISPHKGQEDFVRAAAAVCGVRADVDFLMVGRDSTRRYAFRHALESLSHALGCAGHLAIHPFTDDIPALLSLLDVLVLSSWDEPFGIIVLEGMAAGRAVVATASGGPLEILKHEQTGLLVPPRDPRGLADAILRLLDDEALRARLGAAAQADVRARYDWAQVVAQVEAAYAAP